MAQLGDIFQDTVISTITTVPTLKMVALGPDTGPNIINWKRNGNKPSIQFVIEAGIGTATVLFKPP